MPKKKRRSPPVTVPAAFAWIALTLSLAIIGYACTRKPPAVRTIAHHPHHRAPVAPVTVAATPPPDVAAAPSAAPAGASAVPVSASQAAVTPAPGAASPASSVTATEAPASPSPVTPGSVAHARVALIIDDCGQWPVTERGFIALPVALTMSVLPDVRYNRAIEHEAAAADKGVMLHLPMETLSGVNPGPGKVTTEMSDAAIDAAVEHDLADVDLARGVNNHEGSRATADPRVMNDVMGVLARRGRFFIDSRTNKASVAESIAQQHGVATAARNVFIDNRADVAYTEAQLMTAADVARKNGEAIAIGHPHPTTLAAIRELVPRLQAEGITFVLASSLAK